MSGHPQGGPSVSRVVSLEAGIDRARTSWITWKTFLFCDVAKSTLLAHLHDVAHLQDGAVIVIFDGIYSCHKFIICSRVRSQSLRVQWPGNSLISSFS